MNSSLEKEFGELKVEEIAKKLLFLAGEIDWLAGRVDSFPPGKLRPEENRRVSKARRVACDLADWLLEKE